MQDLPARRPRQSAGSLKSASRKRRGCDGWTPTPGQGIQTVAIPESARAGAHQPGPARHLHRRRIHRRGSPVTPRTLDRPGRPAMARPVRDLGTQPTWSPAVAISSAPRTADLGGRWRPRCSLAEGTDEDDLERRVPVRGWCGLPRGRHVGGCGAQGVGEAGGWLGERVREPRQDDASLFLRPAAHGQDPHARGRDGRE